MQHIQGSLITRSDAMVKCNKEKLVNGHNIPIMGKMHKSKESPDLLAGIFHLLRTVRCSTGLNGSNPEK